MSGGVPAGVEAIRHYVAMRDAKPLRQSGDVIHSVHAGTEWEAELRLSDLRLAATPTPPIEGRDADVERVARALCERNVPGTAGDTVGWIERQWQFYVPDARAALQALGERP